MAAASGRPRSPLANQSIFGDPEDPDRDVMMEAAWSVSTTGAPAPGQSIFGIPLRGSVQGEPGEQPPRAKQENWVQYRQPESEPQRVTSSAASSISAVIHFSNTNAPANLQVRGNIVGSGLSDTPQTSNQEYLKERFSDILRPGTTMCSTLQEASTVPKQKGPQASSSWNVPPPPLHLPSPVRACWGGIA